MMINLQLIVAALIPLVMLALVVALFVFVIQLRRSVRRIEGELVRMRGAGSIRSLTDTGESDSAHDPSA